MNDNQLIRDLIQQEESDILEFLHELDKKTIAKVLASFLNTKGGSIIIGITNNREVVGLKEPSRELNSLKKYLVNAIVPEVPIELQVVELLNRELLVCRVQEGTKQPYIYDGIIYYRQHDEVIKATSSQVSALVHRRQEDETHWERQVHLGIMQEDLDHSLILQTFEKAKAKNRISTYKPDVDQLLTKYGLLSNMYVTNAGGILFAKDGSRYYRQATVRLTEYGGSKTSDSLLRDDYIEGNLFVIIDQLESFVDNLGTKSLITEDNWERKDFKYPPLALREGLMNAIVHRDYSYINSHLTVSVFADRIVIANSGTLPEELGGKAALKKEHRSYPNNPDIAHMFFIRGYIEKLGRGTHKIIEECKKAGLKSPNWEVTDSEVILTIHGPKTDKSSKNDALKVINDALSEAQSDALKSKIDALKIKASKKALDRYYDILSFIYSNENVALKDITHSLSVSRATVQRYLLSLIDRGVIETIGSKKTRKYGLNDALKAKIDALK